MDANVPAKASKFSVIGELKDVIIEAAGDSPTNSMHTTAAQAIAIKRPSTRSLIRHSLFLRRRG
jgi:hypothetical protein